MKMARIFYEKAISFLRKNWWDVRYLSLLVVAFLLFRFDKFVKWLIQDTGSVADWVSGLGTIAAFGVVIWQQNRQENREIAFKVEQSRPRFMLMKRGVLPDETSILTNSNCWKDKKKLEIANNPRSNNLITIENISENSIYKMRIAVEYEKNAPQRWIKNGIRRNEIIALIPDFLCEEKEISKNDESSDQYAKDVVEQKNNVTGSYVSIDTNAVPNTDINKNYSIPDNAVNNREEQENKNSKQNCLKKIVIWFLTSANEQGYYIYNFKKKTEKYRFMKDRKLAFGVKAFGKDKIKSKHKLSKYWNKIDNINTTECQTVPYKTLKEKYKK